MTRHFQNDAEKQSYYMVRKIDKAVDAHLMINEGDRILVGVSGGKDSSALLHILNYRLRTAPVKYTLIAAHIRGDANGGYAESPKELADWVRSMGIEFIDRAIHIPENEPMPMDCERCSRNRRRTLFEIAVDEGCHKVALGHSLDDFAHTALINLLERGMLETMSFNAEYFGGKFRLIRPLAYVREHDIKRLAKACELPVIPSNCPFANATKRQSARDVMSLASQSFRHANKNIVRAIESLSKREPD